MGKPEPASEAAGGRHGPARLGLRRLSRAAGLWPPSHGLARRSARSLPALRRNGRIRKRPGAARRRRRRGGGIIAPAGPGRAGPGQGGAGMTAAPVGATPVVHGAPSRAGPPHPSQGAAPDLRRRRGRGVIIRAAGPGRRSRPVRIRQRRYDRHGAGRRRLQSRSGGAATQASCSPAEVA
jgi:hypothetical protein